MGMVLERREGRSDVLSRLPTAVSRHDPARISLVTVLVAVLAAAAALRLWVGLAFPNFIVPDEIYQYLGQAHRLVFGHGYVPWEFRIGLRSWLIPGLLAGPMAAARLVDATPAFGLSVIRVLLSLASLSVVVVAVLWGRRIEGMRGAWIAGLTAALWPDLWVMAPHPLESALAAYVLLPALYLIEPADGAISLRRTATAAALLGLAFVLRNAIAPAVAVAGIGLCRRDGRRWLVGLAAGAVPVVLAGMLDWLTWGTPFRSFWLNILLNGVDHVGDVFGTSGPATYPATLALDWRWAIPFVAVALWQGAPRLKLTTLTAAAVLLTYWPLAHKEFRFLFPMIALLVPVAGVGLARLSRQIHPALSGVAAVTCLSGMLGSPMFRAELASFVPGARAERAAARLHPAELTAKTATLPSNLFLGSHTRLVFVPHGEVADGGDALIAPRGEKVDGSRYRLRRCFTAPPESSILAAAAPLGECLWVARRKSATIHGVPYGTLMFSPAIARKYELPHGEKTR